MEGGREGRRRSEQSIEKEKGTKLEKV